MSNPRVEALVARLEKGHQKTMEIFGSLDNAAWKWVIYNEPLSWNLHNLLAHFVSAEEKLLLLAKDVASGGKGAPPDFDFDAYNAEEQARLINITPPVLLLELTKARAATLDWLRALEDSQLDRIGRHPALGEVTLEMMVTAIYGHQLLHMRDAQKKLPMNQC
jgi:hypothetical protein